MLTQLTVRDFALVRTLEVPFAPGLTVVTGETGAGKSILLDALALTLGDRAVASNVRSGAQRAEISAEFDLTNLPVTLQWLTERELEDADDPVHLVLRRTIGADGRSRGYINGRSVTAHDLTEIGAQLVDIHGQHAHQLLLRRGAQLTMLDAFADAETLAQQVRAAHQQWSELARRLDEATDADPDGKEAAWLEFQIAELAAVALTPQQHEALNSEHRALSTRGARLDGVQRASAMLSGGEADVRTLLQKTRSALNQSHDDDASLRTALELLDSAAVHIDESARELQRYEARLQPDPERLAELDGQLAKLHNAARKHRVQPYELVSVQANLEKRRDELQNARNERPRREAEMAAARQQFLSLATALSTMRRDASDVFRRDVEAQLHRLGMPAAKFVVQLLAQESSHGLEGVEFQVTTNPELPPGPLARVASGGELSRISLAIQAVASERTRIPTLVLDEADSGVGGATAEIVGQTLRHLGRSTQVLCVTHVPQVAAQGHHHQEVSKDEAGTRITPLDDARRISELARMIGGATLTEKTIARAEEMLRLAAGSASSATINAVRNMSEANDATATSAEAASTPPKTRAAKKETSKAR